MMGRTGRAHCPKPYGPACVIALFVLVFALLAGPPIACAAAEDEPRAAVETLHGALLDVMREAGQMGFDGRRDRLRSVIEAGFDFEYISRLVLGPEWAKLDDGGRARMREALAGLTLDTYAARFDGYGGERFETRTSDASKRGRWLVRTRLFSPDEEDVTLDYLLHRAGGEWRIVNVIANGVSDLSIKRAEYTGIVKSEGFDHLIDAITRQREEMVERARKADRS
ncbi:MAG: ABC transporter substrate-binding protein [Gammaproteobacteria bacterium]